MQRVLGATAGHDTLCIDGAKRLVAKGMVVVVRSNTPIWHSVSCCHTVALIESASRKKSICLQTLKVGANDRSAQELQNGL